MNDALLRVGVDAAKATLEVGFSDGAATPGARQQRGRTRQPVHSLT